MSQTLHTYLTAYPPPPAPLAPEVACKRPSNTASADFSYDDIHLPIPRIPHFSLAHLRTRFGTLLSAHLPIPPPATVSPRRAAPLRCENQLNTLCVRSVLLHLDRALSVTPFPTGHTRITDQEGDSLRAGSKGDRIGTTPAGQIRLVGDVKPSWNWRSEWAEEEDLTLKEQYLQVLSQVHYYMNQKECRWGYVLTDREFVVVERVGREYGRVRVSGSVKWEGGGGGLTLGLAMWFVCMLAAEDGGWRVEGCERPAVELEAGEGGEGEEMDDMADEDWMN